MTKNYQIRIEGQTFTVVVSDEKEALLAAQAAGRAVLGVGKSCEGVEIPAVAQDWSCVSLKLAEQIARRKAELPWIICAGERVTVREAAKSDWNGLIKWGPFKEWPDQAAFQAYIDGQYKFYEYGLWLIEEKKTGLLLGRAGVWNPDEETCRRLKAAGEESGEYLELGYEVFSPYRGKDFAKEACQAIMAYADWELECRLCVRIWPDNLPSLSLAEKLGFRRLREPEASFIPPHKGSGETLWPFLYVWSC